MFLYPFQGTDSFSKDPEEIRQIDKCSLVSNMQIAFCLHFK
jgi:hypothetical protein